MRDALLKAAQQLEIAAAMHREGRLKDAEAGYRRVLVLDPGNAGALGMLGLIAHTRGDSATAVHLIRASLTLKPAAESWYNLALVLEHTGDLIGSLAAVRQAVALDPYDVTNWSTAIFNGDLHPYTTPAIRLADRRAFNRAHCAALTAAAPPHTNDPDPERRLRIGYLGADFVDHSASMAIEPVLRGHDRDQVELYLYWQNRQNSDAHTVRFEAYADRWRVVSGYTDAELAQMIREDRIDILVDLAGYSNGHRLRALARKPAPIIMTGWGHVTGLGIDACDYILADDITAPAEGAHHHTEQVLHLPCTLAFDPRPPYPDVASSPSARGEPVTFGYLGRATKTSERVWAVWAEILHRVPGSRLVFKGREYASVPYRQRIVEFFASLRISSTRLEFQGASDRYNHLKAYNGIDVALDTFPQNGGVTTLEACLMGVPSVVLAGDHLNGMMGASILSTLGRDIWIGQDVEHYIAIAVLLASRPLIPEERADLRADLLGSIICNDAAYAAAVESRYRDAWRIWCASQVPAERELVEV